MGCPIHRTLAKFKPVLYIGRPIYRTLAYSNHHIHRMSYTEDAGIINKICFNTYFHLVLEFDHISHHLYKCKGVIYDLVPIWVNYHILIDNDTRNNYWYLSFWKLGAKLWQFWINSEYKHTARKDKD